MVEVLEMTMQSEKNNIASPVCLMETASGEAAKVAADEAEYIHREIYGEHCCQKDNCFGAYHFSLVKKVLLKALLAAEKRGMECALQIARFQNKRAALPETIIEAIRNAAQKLGDTK
jgi:hypothetical protein